MHDDRSDEIRDSGIRDGDSGPETIFRALKDRPTGELDSHTLWRRIEGELEPRTASWGERIAAAIGLGGLQPATLRLAGVGVMALLVVGIVWLAPGNPPAEMVSEAPLAELTEANQPAWILDVRLVRGYSGTLPADAMASSADGAGGADRLADLRDALDSFAPFDQLALVGQWQGAVGTAGRGDDAASTVARLSDSFALRFDAESADTGLNLADVLLDGAGRPLVADVLALTPGRPYLFGVQAEGEDSETGSLVLAVRLLPADAAEPSGPATDSPEQR